MCHVHPAPARALHRPVTFLDSADDNSGRPAIAIAHVLKYDSSRSWRFSKQIRRWPYSAPSEWPRQNPSQHTTHLCVPTRSRLPSQGHGQTPPSMDCETCEASSQGGRCQDWRSSLYMLYQRAWNGCAFTERRYCGAYASVTLGEGLSGGQSLHRTWVLQIFTRKLFDFWETKMLKIDGM